jgi:hypothetical protein
MAIFFFAGVSALVGSALVSKVSIGGGLVLWCSE